jgi:RNA polymerase sigma factor (TIGR02999 family)
MNSRATNEMTTLLGAVVEGNAAARERVVELAYSQLHEMAAALMQKERNSHTLQPTALVHEAILKFFHKDDVSSIPNRAYFYGAMATAMRRILVDHARTRRAAKRGGDRQQVPLDVTIESVESDGGWDVLELDELLTELEKLDSRASQVVSLRCFGGLEIREIAEQLEVSPSTIDREWRFAKAWLKTRMQH